MFFLVEGYDRTQGAAYGKIVSTQAVAPQQLAGAIIRMMERGGANAVLVTEISEETFLHFYQEGRRIYTHDGHRRRDN